MEGRGRKASQPIRDCLREWVLPVMISKALRTTLEVPFRSSLEPCSALAGVIPSSSTDTVFLQSSLETGGGIARRVEWKNVVFFLEAVLAKRLGEAICPIAHRSSDSYPRPTFFTPVVVTICSYRDSTRRLVLGESRERAPVIVRAGYGSTWQGDASRSLTSILEVFLLLAGEAMNKLASTTAESRRGGFGAATGTLVSQ